MSLIDEVLEKLGLAEHETLEGSNACKSIRTEAAARMRGVLEACAEQGTAVAPSDDLIDIIW